MLLIIPSIEIKNGNCARKVQGIGKSIYSDDPIEIAKLWRKENAKSLHVTDCDGVAAGTPVNFETVRRMVKTVDIPIELGGGITKFEDAQKAFDNGIYRIVIGTMLIDNPSDAKRTLDAFGPSKVVLGLDTRFVYKAIKSNVKSTGFTPLSIAFNAKQIGFRRILYTDVVVDGSRRKPNFKAIRQLAEQTQLKVTVSGGISNLDDLLELQEFEPLGIDSVIIGRALYENKFSCQGLWRLCEAGNYPYTAKI
jgi:phosphoribosylformimino-5-aminoimidazole carboxamide ribotide isomerase